MVLAKRAREDLQISFALYKVISFKSQMNKTTFLGVQSCKGE